MYFSFDLIDVQLYTVKIWHPCIFSTKIWTSIKSSKKYIFGILKCHISTPCTQIPSQNPSPTYKPFKDTVALLVFPQKWAFLPPLPSLSPVRPAARAALLPRSLQTDSAVDNPDNDLG